MPITIWIDPDCVDNKSQSGSFETDDVQEVMDIIKPALNSNDD